MTDKNPNLQDRFLNKIRKDRIPVTVFLLNGVKLQGVIVWFDNFSMLMRREEHSQLIYKHSISTIMPSQAFNLFEEGEYEAMVASSEA